MRISRLLCCAFVLTLAGCGSERPAADEPPEEVVPPASDTAAEQAAEPAADSMPERPAPPPQQPETERPAPTETEPDVSRPEPVEAESAADALHHGTVPIGIRIGVLLQMLGTVTGQFLDGPSTGEIQFGS